MRAKKITRVNWWKQTRAAAMAPSSRTFAAVGPERAVQERVVPAGAPDFKPDGEASVAPIAPEPGARPGARPISQPFIVVPYVAPQQAISYLKDWDGPDAGEGADGGAYYEDLFGDDEPDDLRVGRAKGSRRKK